MAEESAEALFARVRSFGWDNAKRDGILRERGIDFEELRFLFDGPINAIRSDRSGEARYVVGGFLDGRSVHSARRCVLDHYGTTCEAG